MQVTFKPAFREEREELLLGIPKERCVTCERRGGSQTWPGSPVHVHMRDSSHLLGLCWPNGPSCGRLAFLKFLIGSGARLTGFSSFPRA